MPTLPLSISTSIGLVALAVASCGSSGGPGADVCDTYATCLAEADPTRDREAMLATCQDDLADALEDGRLSDEALTACIECVDQNSCAELGEGDCAIACAAVDGETEPPPPPPPPFTGVHWSWTVEGGCDGIGAVELLIDGEFSHLFACEDGETTLELSAGSYSFEWGLLDQDDVLFSFGDVGTFAVVTDQTTELGESTLTRQLGG